MLYTGYFEVGLENGDTDKIMANQIDANIYSQLDYEGHEIIQSKDIIDYKKGGSDLTKESKFTVQKGGYKNCKPTMRGWKVLAE